MKYLTLVTIALLGIAATTCIDGAWSASRLWQPVDRVIERTLEPGKALLSGLERSLGDALTRSSRQAANARSLKATKNRVIATGANPGTDDSSVCG